ncbi:MAG TPA: hypothetical protein VFX17_03685 [Patescibacteria group bacterium]|nr:hypothetical protein [Patescibacteria group bacterium]
MQRIEAVGPKVCTNCRLAVTMTAVYVQGKNVVVITECQGCGLEYSSKFLLPGMIDELGRKKA